MTTPELFAQAVRRGFGEYYPMTAHITLVSVRDMGDAKLVDAHQLPPLLTRRMTRGDARRAVKCSRSIPTVAKPVWLNIIDTNDNGSEAAHV